MLILSVHPNRIKCVLLTDFFSFFKESKIEKKMNKATIYESIRWHFGNDPLQVFPRVPLHVCWCVFKMFSVWWLKSITYGLEFKAIVHLNILRNRSFQTCVIKTKTFLKVSDVFVHNESPLGSNIQFIIWINTGLEQHTVQIENIWQEILFQSLYLISNLIVMCHS